MAVSLPLGISVELEEWQSTVVEWHKYFDWIDLALAIPYWQ